MLGKRFRNREGAGSKLAPVLSQKGLQRPIVLGIPRGGMVVAATVAKALAADLGVVVSKKLAAPYQPELTLGAVTSDGVAYFDTPLADEVGASRQYLREEQNRQAELARQQQIALNDSISHALDKRDVVVVVDGLTTGASAISVTRWALLAGAAKVIIASPVGPPDVLSRLRDEATEVVCLLEAPGFLSVAQFYEDFGSIDDDDIRKLLRNHPSPGRDNPTNC